VLESNEEPIAPVPQFAEVWGNDSTYFIDKLYFNSYLHYSKLGISAGFLDQCEFLPA
jgi:hypothetical protein